MPKQFNTSVQVRFIGDALKSLNMADAGDASAFFGPPPEGPQHRRSSSTPESGVRPPIINRSASSNMADHFLTSDNSTRPTAPSPIQTASRRYRSADNSPSLSITQVAQDQVQARAQAEHLEPTSPRQKRVDSSIAEPIDLPRSSSSLVLNLFGSSASPSALPESLSFSLSADGRWVTAWSSSRVYLFSTADLPAIKGRAFQLKHQVTSAGSVKDGKMLVILSRSSQVEVLRVQPHNSSEQVATAKSIVLSEDAHVIAVSPDGCLLAAGFAHGIELVALRDTPRSLPERRIVQCDAMDSLEFSADSQSLIATSFVGGRRHTTLFTIAKAPSSREDSDETEAQQYSSTRRRQPAHHTWLKEVLFPERTPGAQQAVLMQSNSEGVVNHTFSFNAERRQWGVYDVHGKRHVQLMKTAAGPGIQDDLAVPQEAIPAVSATTKRVAAAMCNATDNFIWVYQLPDDPNSDLWSDRKDPAGTETTIPESSTTLPKTPELGFFNVTGVRWITARGEATAAEKLAIAGNIVPESTPVNDYTDGPECPAGQIIVMHVDERGWTGASDMLGGLNSCNINIDDTLVAEPLPQAELTFDREVELVRRRSTAPQANSQPRRTRTNARNLNLRRAVTSPIDSATTPVGNDRHAVSWGQQDLRDGETPLTSDEVQASLDQPYANAQPRSRLSLSRAATVAAASPAARRHLHSLPGRPLPTSSGRPDPPHESDADNWVPPPPTYDEHQEDALLDSTARSQHAQESDLNTPPIVPNFPRPPFASNSRPVSAESSGRSSPYGHVRRATTAGNSPSRPEQRASQIRRRPVQTRSVSQSDAVLYEDAIPSTSPLTSLDRSPSPEEPQATYQPSRNASNAGSTPAWSAKPRSSGQDSSSRMSMPVFFESMPSSEEFAALQGGDGLPSSPGLQSVRERPLREQGHSRQSSRHSMVESINLSNRAAPGDRPVSPLSRLDFPTTPKSARSTVSQQQESHSHSRVGGDLLPSHMSTISEVSSATRSSLSTLSRIPPFFGGSRRSRALDSNADNGRHPSISAMSSASGPSTVESSASTIDGRPSPPQSRSLLASREGDDERRDQVGPVPQNVTRQDDARGRRPLHSRAANSPSGPVRHPNLTSGRFPSESGAIVSAAGIPYLPPRLPQLPFMEDVPLSPAASTWARDRNDSNVTLTETIASSSEERRPSVPHATANPIAPPPPSATLTRPVTLLTQPVAHYGPSNAHPASANVISSRPQMRMPEPRRPPAVRNNSASLAPTIKSTDDALAKKQAMESRSKSFAGLNFRSGWRGRRQEQGLLLPQTTYQPPLPRLQLQVPDQQQQGVSAQSPNTAKSPTAELSAFAEMAARSAGDRHRSVPPALGTTTAGPGTAPSSQALRSQSQSGIDTHIPTAKENGNGSANGSRSASRSRSRFSFSRTRRDRDDSHTRQKSPRRTRPRPATAHPSPQQHNNSHNGTLAPPHSIHGVVTSDGLYAPLQDLHLQNRAAGGQRGRQGRSMAGLVGPSSPPASARPRPSLEARWSSWRSERERGREQARADSVGAGLTLKNGGYGAQSPDEIDDDGRKCVVM